MSQHREYQDKIDSNGNSNKIKVLQIIRDRKEITRAEIIRISGLSAPTVTRIVESLLQLELIHSESTGSSIGGRRPQLISFNSKDNYVIGIDIGGTFIRSALSNLDGEFIFEIQIPCSLKMGFEAVMEQVGGIIEKLSDRATQNKLKIWGIGIAICGMVNKNTGMVEYSPIFNWTNVDVRKALAKYTRLNIVLGNVVQLFALGELLYGVGKKYSDFICINLGYGIGSGIITNGRLFGGADGIAGEIGHIVIDHKSKRKGMEGIKGTLESLASGYGIAEIAQEQSSIHKDSLLHSMESHEIDAIALFDAARKEDALALDILDSVATALCVGIDTLIKLFNTECIVLSGGLIQNDDLLLEKVRGEIDQYAMKALSRSVPIICSSFGENAALMGSFSLILEKILQLEHIKA